MGSTVGQNRQQAVIHRSGKEAITLSPVDGKVVAVNHNIANEAGIANEKIWVDGIVTPVNIQQPQLISLMEFQGMLDDIAPGAKSTCGLSNISNGPPEHLRPILNQTYMVMLQKYGMKSVIADPLDDQLIDIAKGNRQDIVDLIYGIMDGTEPDMDSLSKEMLDYAKTTNVILGKTLYSDSWLEI